MVMPRTEFEDVLLSGNEEIHGCIALIADILKSVCAEKHPRMAHYDYTTIIDCDSIWLQKAVPPRQAWGHATATLMENKASHLNANISKRLNHLSYQYCRNARDFAKVATPVRWPKGSPALASMNLRIVPFINSGVWKGGIDFEVVMNVMWDTMNNWGLRSGMNDALVHTPVPWFAREKPLTQDSAISETVHP